MAQYCHTSGQGAILQGLLHPSASQATLARQATNRFEKCCSMHCPLPSCSQQQRRQLQVTRKVSIDRCIRTWLVQVEKAKRSEQTVAVCVFEVRTTPEGSRRLLLAQRPNEGLLAGKHTPALARALAGTRMPPASLIGKADGPRRHLP